MVRCASHVSHGHDKHSILSPTTAGTPIPLLHIVPHSGLPKISCFSYDECKALTQRLWSQRFISIHNFDAPLLLPIRSWHRGYVLLPSVQRQCKQRRRVGSTDQLLYLTWTVCPFGVFSHIFLRGLHKPTAHNRAQSKNVDCTDL